MIETTSIEQVATGYCQCSLAGYCNRHGVKKTRREWQLCQGESQGVSEDVANRYRDAWDASAMPGQSGVSAVQKTPAMRGERRSVHAPVTRQPRERVGDELNKTLPWFGSRRPCCGQLNRADELNRRGCDWCDTNIETVVGWIAEEAARSRNSEYADDTSPEIAERITSVVKTAIANARIAAGAVRKNTGPFTPSDAAPKFITVEQLMRDAKRLASMLPPNTSQIIGVARSGLCVATMVAMLRHLPLTIFRQSSYDMTPGGNGWRLTGNVGFDSGPPIVIDDTCMSGNSFKYIMPVVKSRYPNAMSAAVYVNPGARRKPDIWVSDLPWPHLLEWNLFNSVLSPNIAVDFDGILCHDCPPGSDDDGPRYAKFLHDTKPLYVIRKVKIPLIVTARLEKYRPQTMDWLNRHGIAVENLVMGPWKTLGERHRHNVADFKAEHYSVFLKDRKGIKPPLFVESEEWQAKRIAELSGGLVVCPAAGKVF